VGNFIIFPSVGHAPNQSLGLRIMAKILQIGTHNTSRLVTEFCHPMTTEKGITISYSSPMTTSRG
jgi:hypothetical protein